MKRLIVLVGPTCSGKSTLEQELIRRGCATIRSYTTRSQRVGEVDGVHYDFLTEEQVADLFIRDRVLQSVRFTGYQYGSTVDALEEAFKANDTAVIVVEPTGLTQYQAYADRTGDLEIVSVFITNDVGTLCQRLVARAASDDESKAAYNWKRLCGIIEQAREWPYYITNWTHFIERMDDASPQTSVASVAERVLGAKTR
jgi:guanylate kinase